MFFIIKDFRWVGQVFCVVTDVGSDDGVFRQTFDLEFSSPTHAKSALSDTVLAVANLAWGSAYTSVHGSGVIAGAQQTDAKGNPMVTLAPTTAVGLASVTTQDMPDSAENYRRSWMIECPATQVTIRDLCVSGDLTGATGVCLVQKWGYTVLGGAIGSAVQVAIVDRDDLLGYFTPYGMSRSKVTISGAHGIFVVGEEIRGTTCRTKILAVFDDHLDITFSRYDANDQPATFVSGETLTGQTSGATATFGAFVEGDVIYVQSFVKDESLYPNKHHEEHPGGTRSLPQGLYFRLVVYNASTTDTLWFDASISVGKM